MSAIWLCCFVWSFAPSVIYEKYTKAPLLSILLPQKSQLDVSNEVASHSTVMYNPFIIKKKHTTLEVASSITTVAIDKFH